MSEQPISLDWTDADNEALTLLLIKSAYGLAIKAEADERDEAKKRHPAGRGIAAEFTSTSRSTYVPLIAPPLPNWAGLGTFITISLASVLTVTGLLIGITSGSWVALPLTISGVLLAGRVAIVHYRATGEKS